MVAQGGDPVATVTELRLASKFAGSIKALSSLKREAARGFRMKKCNRDAGGQPSNPPVQGGVHFLAAIAPSSGSPEPKTLNPKP